MIDRANSFGTTSDAERIRQRASQMIKEHDKSGNGILESTTGKGVFDELTIVPADGLGRYNLYLDNFQFIAFEP